MPDRPIITLKPQPIDFLLDVLSWTLLLTLWVIVLISYYTLPERIPIHFNFAGEVDGWSEKQMIFFHPALATSIMIVLTLISRYPHTFNYPVQITPENAERNYRLGVRVIKFVRVATILLFIYAAVSTIWVANKDERTISPITLYIFLAVMAVIIITYLVISTRKKS